MVALGLVTLHLVASGVRRLVPDASPVVLRDLVQVIAELDPFGRRHRQLWVAVTDADGRKDVELDERGAQLVGDVEQVEHVAPVGLVDGANDPGVETALTQFGSGGQRRIEGSFSPDGVVRGRAAAIQADLHVREVRWFETSELAQRWCLGVSGGDDVFVAELLGRADRRAIVRVQGRLATENRELAAA